MTEAQTFLWHDYETTGTDPRRDRPCQFAAIRTDLELRPIGEPVTLYCQPSMDVLPLPEACLITGIAPQLCQREGLPEPAFAKRINAIRCHDSASARDGYANPRWRRSPRVLIKIDLLFIGVGALHRRLKCLRRK